MKRTVKTIITSLLISTLTLAGADAFAFTDMADTEKSVLAERLGIISGYEDGSFKPDNEVTRAEAAAIISRAIGWSDEDAEVIYKNSIERHNEGRVHSNYVMDFDDYNALHWANKYVQAGLENGFISGYDDGTFRYEDKITLNQLVTMLVGATGYGTYADAAGGYPNGYLHWGAATGITNGLTAKDYTKNATRGEVLSCVMNAADAPVCIVKNWTVSWNGESVPELAIMDGEGREWQTLLIRTHNIYTAEAEVTDIAKSVMKVRLISSDNFADEKIDEKNSKTVQININDTVEKGKKYKMYIRELDYDNGEYELVYAVEIK